ncbi:MAG: DUF2911 domain-containing protein [Candidatus Hydrogenedentota bacterium]
MMNIMKRVFAGLMCIGATAVFAGYADAQGMPKPSQPASVSQTIGTKNKITITYHRPGVKGRNVWQDRSDNEQIGPLVPRDGKPRPWRAGANNSTSIEFTEDVKIGGKDVPAGKYAIFMIPTDDEWIVIINKKVQWGSFTYDKESDVARVSVKPQDALHQEWLVYGFENPGAYSTTAYLRWEKVKIPFEISMDEK